MVWLCFRFPLSLRSIEVLPRTGESHPCSAPIEAPVGPHGLDDHHLAKVLAREEADEDSLGIGDGHSRGLRSVKPIEHGLKRGRALHRLDRGAHKSGD